MRLIVIGPQGSGKGTQAEFLAKTYHLHHISSGEVFRNAVRRNTALGKKVAPFINRGHLVPDEIANEFIKKMLKKHPNFGFVLDGYPRTKLQAEFLEGLTEIDRVIEIYLPAEISLKRLSSRLNCPQCGKIYSAAVHKLKGKKCPDCGGRLVRRKDDYPEAIRRRLEIYRYHTRPILRFYKEKGLLLKINGRGSIEHVFERIERALELLRTLEE